MEKWYVYMNIYQLKQQGFRIRRIAKKLGISRTTVYKYLEKSPEEMSEWMASTQTRRKKLDPYEMLIQTWLSEHPDMSAAQVHDWLLERYSDVKVGESTVRQYVNELRGKYDIPKMETTRDHEGVQDPPMGQQAQVDFGHTVQKTADGKESKLTFISFVLSHSRYKFVEWLDRPFTTKDVIRSHENAFQAFGGIPYEIVYDQDALIVVSENAGDLILTGEFQAYREERKLTMYVCRKADPQSKGKIENVVKFVKQNFSKNRIFGTLERWNEQSELWLERTGNGRVHNTTKKRPVEVFTLERQHLRPVTTKLTISRMGSSITRTVRKDNTILYKSNRYSVPLGTYKQDKKVYIETTDEHRLVIREQQEGPVIANHTISLEKGALVQDRQHTRDRTKGIPAYISTVAEKFEDRELAMTFLEAIHKTYPRYIRDQLQLILKVLKEVESEIGDEALQVCVQQGIHSATEFSDVVQYIKRQRQVDQASLDQTKEPIKPFHGWNESVGQTKPQTREVNDYLALLEGGSV